VLVSRARLGSLYETNSGLRLQAKIEQANIEDAGREKPGEFPQSVVW